MALRRNVWNPPPIGRSRFPVNGRRCPVEIGLGPLTEAFHARNHNPAVSWKRLALCPPPAEVITKGTGFRRRSRPVGHPLSDGFPLLDARVRGAAKLMIP